jgi:CRISPR/Cas system CSM-associated protein Csm3 (group 7 of RAMP superfamily)
MIYLARFVIELETPLHCGGGESQDCDQPVIRDAFGLYAIPGSSLAGLMRSAARLWYPPPSSDRLSKSAQEPRAVRQAFGFITQNENESQSSSIWCRDGRLLDFDGSFADERFRKGQEIALPLGPYLRDHVRIDSVSGAAAAAGKFDEEYAPTGLRFALEFSLDGWNEQPSQETLDLFLSLGGALKSGNLRFGGKAAEGFGRLKALQGQCRRFDLTTKEGTEAWLNLSPGPLFGDREGEETAFKEPPRPPVEGLSGSLSLPMEATGPMLVGGLPEPGQPEEADMVFYREPFCDYERKTVTWANVLPGSSIRGVLRHRAHLVAGSLFPKIEADKLVDSIFGKAGGGSPAKAGKVFFEDVRLPEIKETVVQHVAIDRFSGGALESALYSEAPLWGPELKFKLKLDFRSLNELEAAVLAQALLDLAQGHLSVGAGGNRGNGYMRLRDGATRKGLMGVSGEIRWDREILSPQCPEMAQNWLERLEQALEQALAQGHAA